MAPKRAKESGPRAARHAKSSRGASKPVPTATGGAVEDIEDVNFAPEEVERIRGRLLDWYDHSHRILPWRRNPHSKLSAEAVAAAAAQGQTGAPLDLPQNEFIYYVWVCEIMSQQTQVSRAADYFRRWVARWPTVSALAAASQEEVNELWAGLGYYRRARYLLDGAKYIVGQLGGSFPTTAKELQSIPGVGAYTSAAIASIACGERSAVVDGNVVRVLARLRRVGADPRSAASTKLWADLAAQLLDPKRPGDFNQAVMELGATVCVPNTEPKCGDCPVSTSCSAYHAVQRYRADGGDPTAAGAPRVTDYPAKVEKAEKREETVVVAVVQLLPPGAPPSTAASTGAVAGSGADLGGNRFLLVQRPPSGLLAGLWQFPLLPLGAGDEGAPSRQQQLMDEYLEAQLGMRLQQQGQQEQQQGQRRKQQQAKGSSAGVGAVTVVERRPLGQLVHVFSHIRMTMRVEQILLQGDIDTSPRPADESAGLAALQWVPGAEMGAKGLTSGVKKVYKLFTDSRSKAASKQRTTAFFKPKPAAAAAAAARAEADAGGEGRE